VQEEEPVVRVHAPGKLQDAAEAGD
jgi:hypothetical protein